VAAGNGLYCAWGVDMTISIEAGRERRGKRVGALSRLWSLVRHDQIERLGVGKVADTMAVEIEAHRDTALVAAEWRELEPRAVETPFQTFAFCEGWYAAARASGQADPLIMVARDRHSGQPLIILPFAMSRRGPFTVIAFADLGMSDINLPIIEPGLRARTEAAREVLRATLAALPRADYFELDKMPATYADGTINPLILKRGVLHKENGIHHIPLGHPWADHAKQLQSKSLRKNIARCQRGLEAEGTVVVRTPTEPADIDRCFQALRELRKERYAATDRGDVLQQPRFRDFYHGLLHRHAPDMHARMTVLEVDGVLVAAECGLVWNGVEHLVLPAIAQDPRWRRYSPGHVVMDALFATRAAAGDRRVSLGVGDDAYKSAIGTVRRELYSLRRDLSLRGAMLEAGDEVARRLRDSDIVRGFYKRHLKSLFSRPDKSNP
jgi:CelD/BcsL family acetyltransferase involved in cellulose biosynthesis